MSWLAPSCAGGYGSASPLLLGEGLVFAGWASEALGNFVTVAVSLHILVEPLIHLPLNLSCLPGMGGVGGQVGLLVGVVVGDSWQSERVKAV